MHITEKGPAMRERKREIMGENKTAKERERERERGRGGED